MIYYTIDEYVAQGDAVFARGSCAWTNKHTGRHFKSIFGAFATERR